MAGHENHRRSWTSIRPGCCARQMLQPLSTVIIIMETPSRVGWFPMLVGSLGMQRPLEAYGIGGHKNSGSVVVA
eukprot:1427184-Amphidinium_carterae.1